MSVRLSTTRLSIRTIMCPRLTVPRFNVRVSNEKTQGVTGVGYKYEGFRGSVGMGILWRLPQVFCGHGMGMGIEIQSSRQPLAGLEIGRQLERPSLSTVDFLRREDSLRVEWRKLMERKDRLRISLMVGIRNKTFAKTFAKMF